MKCQYMPMEIAIQDATRRWMKIGIQMLMYETRSNVLEAERRDFGVGGARTFVDVRRVGLLARLGALLLVARGSGLLAGLLLLSGCLGSRCLGGGLLLCCGLGSHFELI